MAFSLAAIVVFPLSASVDTGQSRLFKYLMGTSMRVETYGGDVATRQEASDEAFAAIAEVDRLLSSYRPDSELAAVNRAAATAPVTVSPPFLAILEAAARVARQSDGAFDLAVGAHASFHSVAIDSERRVVSVTGPGVQLNLDGLAKGFAAEVAAGSLRRRNLAGTVDAGGTQYMVGLPPGKRSWSVGIGHPSRRGELLGAIDVEGGAVATVALASRPLDPRTGTPATAALSATVVSPDGTLADALSKAVYVLGPVKGLALLEHFPTAWAVVAYRQPDGGLGITVSPDHARAFHPAAH